MHSPLIPTLNELNKRNIYLSQFPEAIEAQIPQGPSSHCGTRIKADRLLERLCHRTARHLSPRGRCRAATSTHPPPQRSEPGGAGWRGEGKRRGRKGRPRRPGDRRPTWRRGRWRRSAAFRALNEGRPEAARVAASAPGAPRLPENPPRRSR